MKESFNGLPRTERSEGRFDKETIHAAADAELDQRLAEIGGTIEVGDDISPRVAAVLQLHWLAESLQTQAERHLLAAINRRLNTRMEDLTPEDHFSLLRQQMRRRAANQNSPLDAVALAA